MIEISEQRDYKNNIKKTHAEEVMERKDAAEQEFNKKQKARENTINIKLKRIE